MMVDTNALVTMTEANQNFSKVVHMVEEDGMAVILKNNRPRFIVVDFDEYEELQLMLRERMEKINDTADRILEENMDAFMELAK